MVGLHALQRLAHRSAADADADQLAELQLGPDTVSRQFESDDQFLELCARIVGQRRCAIDPGGAARGAVGTVALLLPGCAQVGHTRAVWPFRSLVTRRWVCSAVV